MRDGGCGLGEEDWRWVEIGGGFVIRVGMPELVEIGGSLVGSEGVKMVGCGICIRY